MSLVFRGWRYWFDVYFYAGWKVQKYALEDEVRYRVISPDGSKFHYKTEDDAFQHISKIKEKGLRPKSKHLVIVIPGLNNVLFTFSVIRRFLRDHGYECMVWDYASNRADTRKHAERLGKLISKLEGIDKVSFVTHSLGGLILRTFLATDKKWTEKFECGDIVMIAPPHNGSFVADFARRDKNLDAVFDFVAGKVKHDLTSAGACELPALEHPVSILVGGTRRKFGFNPLSSEDNDGLVHIDSSRVDTATNFIQIKNWSHTTMLMNKVTAQIIVDLIT